jgi:hypothetical protein
MKRITVLAILIMGLLTAANAAVWQKKTAPLMTTWGENLTSDNVWAEYPRPSMTRDSWMNLNGVWQYYKRTSINYDYEPAADRFDKAILVPFPVESALSGIMDTNFQENKRSTHMYRRTFSLPADFAGKNVLLHFGAVDWRCTVYVNGKAAGSHDGGSDPFSFDITSLLNASGDQELQVAVWDPTSDGGQPNGKQNNYPNGIWYTPNSGIWQTVWLEPVAEAHITSYEPIPDIDNGSVSIKVNATDMSAKAKITVKFDGTEVASAEGNIGEFTTIAIPSAKLWSPDEPNLYDVDITLLRNGQPTDKVQGYFGMRKFSRGMALGKPCVMLNNKPLFMYGPLDQGWWPDGLLTPPSYEAMVYDLQVMKDFGMNMVRKHIKVENDLWFEWCDRNGLVVWQDMPSGGGGGMIGVKSVCQEQFYKENEAIINATRQHPCIGAWVVFNEGWGQDAGSGMAHTHRGVTEVMNANHDAGRFVHAVTGWVDVEMGDFIDVHSYPSPNAVINPVNERVASCGEFGGINLFIDGHMWAGSDVNYTTVGDSQTYTNLYDHYTDRLQELQRDKGLWMSVYTQITDVEQECNGLLTYDRKVKKVSDEEQARMRDNIRRTINSRYNGSTTVVPAGDEDATLTWRYTTQEPAAEWFETSFDDSSWTTGLAPFGSDTNAGTKWTNDNIWIRRTFTLSGVTAEQLKDLRLWLFHDEDAEIYINGVLASKATGYNNGYEDWPLLPEGLAAIKTDGSENVIAIHCRQTVGGQGIDCGLKLRSYTENSDLNVTEMPAQTPKPEFKAYEDKAYIMAYTTTKNQQLHYAYSRNGAEWTVINGNRPVFRYDNKLASPYIRKVNVDGKDVFHMVAERSDGIPGLLHWLSSDMITWTPTVENTPEVNLPDLQKNYAKAPEVIYESNSGRYYIYYTAAANGQNNVYLTMTKDFISFSTPRIYFDPGFGAEDIHIEKMGDKFYAFFYNADRNINVASSSDLRVYADNFSDVRRIFGGEITKSNAPQSFPALDGSGWLLYYNRTNGTGMGMSGTGNASEIKWYPYNEDTFSLPKDVDKSSVVVVNEDQLDAVLKAYNNVELQLLPTAEIEPQSWRYNNNAFSSLTWTGINFNDSFWKIGTAGFGAGTPPNSIINTRWSSDVINMRCKLDLTGLTPEQIQAIEGRIYYDEDVNVYFNGVEAFSATGYITNYKNILINQEALDALTPDANNVVAVKCRNTYGGQYIDFGLTTIKPISTDIDSVVMKNKPVRKGIYNLLGQKLDKPRKGINIIDGQKVFVTK